MMLSSVPLYISLPSPISKRSQTARITDGGGCDHLIKVASYRGYVCRVFSVAKQYLNKSALKSNKVPNLLFVYPELVFLNFEVESKTEGIFMPKKEGFRVEKQIEYHAGCWSLICM